MTCRAVDGSADVMTCHAGDGSAGVMTCHAVDYVHRSGVDVGEARSDLRVLL